MKNKNIILLFVMSFLLFVKLYSIEPPKKLIVKDIVLGKSDKVVSNNDIVHVHYKGWLFNSNLKVESYCEAKGKKFDDTNDKKLRKTYGILTGEFSFELGRNLVISGWELGLKNMKIGGKRCLVIPPNLAYGARRIDDIIPANSTLIFEIELVNIENKKES